jgi:hypothetical protein
VDTVRAKTVEDSNSLKITDPLTIRPSTWTRRVEQKVWRGRAANDRPCLLGGKATLPATDEEKAEVRSYLEWQLRKTTEDGESVVVRNVEKVSAENATGDRFEIWSCITNQGNWWVVTPMMNFYPQEDFKSADVVLTFHVGMVGRIMSRDEAPLAPELPDISPSRGANGKMPSRRCERLKKQRTTKPWECDFARRSFQC